MGMALVGTWLFGFGFDRWYSGMSMEESIRYAKSKNIAMVTREYAERLNRMQGFDAKFINELDRNRLLIYRAPYMDEATTVQLYFTKKIQV